MTSIKSTQTAASASSYKSTSQGREILNIGIVLPTEERHPVGWLATRALGAEIERVGNRSTGKQGYAIAEAALARGAEM